MKRSLIVLTMTIISFLFLTATSYSFKMPFTGSKFQTLKPVDKAVSIPLNKISDGKAHYFKVKSDSGLGIGLHQAAQLAQEMNYRLHLDERTDRVLFELRSNEALVDA